MKSVIVDTGAKGFLKWVKQDMPAFYAVLSPALIQTARNQVRNYGMGRLPRKTRRQLTNIYRGSFKGRESLHMAGLGDYYVTPITVTADPITNTVDTYDIAPIDSTVDTSGGVVAINLPGASTTGDAASAANTGSTTTAFGSAVTAIAGAVVAGTKAASQVANNNSLLQTNLQRAQQGLPPLTSTTTASGQTLLSGGMGSLLLIGGAIFAAMSLSKE